MLARKPDPDNRYPGSQAQYLHSRICEYIRTANRSDAPARLLRLKELFTKKINSCERGALGEVSANGFTHLMDAIHLPYTNMCSGDSEQTAIDLLSAFDALVPNSNKNFQDRYHILRALLLHPNNANYNPLHQAVKSNSVAVLNSYLALLSKAYAANLFFPNELETLFTSKTNESGNTPLHFLILQKNKGMVKALALFIKTHFPEDAKSLWATLLNQGNKSLQSPGSICPDIAFASLELFADKKPKPAKAAPDSTQAVLTALADSPAPAKKKRRRGRGGSDKAAAAPTTTDTPQQGYISSSIYGLFGYVDATLRQMPIVSLLPRALDYFYRGNTAS